MRNYIIALLVIFIGILYITNRNLHGQLKSREPYYRSNLSKEEMQRVLAVACNDSIYLFVPGDTSVMPYLIKAKKEPVLQGEYVRR